jgi:hypothetical protein
MKGMDAQEYADRFGLYLRKESNGAIYGHSKLPAISRSGWGAIAGVVYKVPPSVIFPDGPWDTTIIDPRSDASELKDGQPIIVWSNGMPEVRRYFSHVRNGIVYAYKDGTTKWTGKGEVSSWLKWRLPTEEELKT